jgi:YrbI family 3-deoxy-D-manno-octulosonate 8-phosphate phosphatase
LRREQVAFVGNDVNDLDCLGWVGAPLAVQDAVPKVRAVACWITERPGGYGAVREICDLILEQRVD